MDQELLKELVYRGHESTDLDYKRDMAWAEPGKYDLIKDIMAFANRGGGYMVIGVDEAGETTADRYKGVSANNRPSWDDTKVSRDVNNFTRPQINLRIEEYTDPDENRQFIVISIPSHKETPHICINQAQKKGRHVLRKAALYIRTNNKETAEISDPGEYANLIRRCTVSDNEKLISDIRALIGMTPVTRFKIQRQERKHEPFTIMNRYLKEAIKWDKLTITTPVFQELLADPVEQIEPIDVEPAKVALAHACVDYRGWPFVFFLPRVHYDHSPKYTDDGVFAHADAPPDWREKADYWGFNYKYGTFYSRKLTPESSLQAPDHFDPYMQVQLMGEAVIALGRLYRSLGLPLDSSIHMACRYSPLRQLRVANVDTARPIIHSGPPFAGTTLTNISIERVGDMLTGAPAIASSLIMALMKKTGYEGGLSVNRLREYSESRLKGGKRLNGLDWMPEDDSEPTP